MTSRESENLQIDENSNMSASSLLRASIRNLEFDSSSEDDMPSGSANALIKAYAEIDTYTEGRVDIDSNLVEYWERKKYFFPYLKEIFDVVHAVPATQVSVERSFSALRLVLSDLRCNLSDTTLEVIMFLKLNKNF